MLFFTWHLAKIMTADSHHLPDNSGAQQKATQASLGS